APAPTLPLNPNQDIPQYDTDAPDTMLNTYTPYSGNDVDTKTYLWLEWMKMNPENSNGAEYFLLYLSNVCAVANGKNSPYPYDSKQFQDFSDAILSINNGEKT